MEKILVIEPDTLLCQEAVKEIRGLGYSKVFSAFNGEEALLLLQKEKPHLVVLNMSLPDYFGLEFPELVCSKSIVYGKPCFILLWDSFFVLETPSVLEKKYRIMHLIKKPYEVTQLLEPVKTILSSEIISAPSASVSQDIPVEYIQVFIESAENFFQTMTSLQPKVGQFFFKNDPFSQSGVSARMEIKGVMEGTVCISFDKPVATFVVSDMLQEDMGEFNEDVKDGIGEVVNIITGNTKSFFQQKKIPFEIGLPKIFTGKHYTHPLSPKVPCIVVPFITPRGTLFVEICVMINENAKLEEQESIPSVKVQQSKQQEMVTQPDIEKLQAEMAATMPKPPEVEKPPPVMDAPPAAGGLSQAEIEKMQAEMAASQSKQEEAKPAPAAKEDTPPHVAEQPDIEKIQAEMAASQSKQEKAEPAPAVKKDTPPHVAEQPDIEKIPVEMSDTPAKEEKEESPQPAPSTTPGAMSQSEIEKIQAEMMASQSKQEEAEPAPAAKEDTPPHVAEQPDTEKIPVEMSVTPAKEEKEESPQPAPSTTPGAMSQSEIEKIQAEMMAKLTNKPSPPAAAEENAPPHVAEQPDIKKIQAEIEASAPSEPQEQPKPHDIGPKITPEEIQRIQAQMAAENATGQNQEKPHTEQTVPSPPPEPMAPPAQDDGKPKIILSKAPVLKQEPNEKSGSTGKPKILSSSPPSLNIEPKKPSTEYRFKPSEPNAQPSNLQPPTSDDEQKTEEP